MPNELAVVSFESGTGSGSFFQTTRALPFRGDAELPSILNYSMKLRAACQHRIDARDEAVELDHIVSEKLSQAKEPPQPARSAHVRRRRLALAHSLAGGTLRTTAVWSSGLGSDERGSLAGNEFSIVSSRAASRIFHSSSGV